MKNVSAVAHKYSSHSEKIRSTNDLEYDVIMKVTRDLKRFQSVDGLQFPNLVRALHRNEKLWTEIGVQVADQANQLPKELRAKLFFIAEFVAMQTSRILKKQADVSSLIDINVAVLRGLKVKVAV